MPPLTFASIGSGAGRIDRPAPLTKEGKPPLAAHPMREGLAPPSNALPWGKRDGSLHLFPQTPISSPGTIR